MVKNHYRWDFIGLSTDTKPTPATSEKVVDGSTYYCSDTSKLYVYCKDNWYERKPLGGGGGGGSYTAGNGITINGDVISGNQIHTLTEDDATGTYFGEKYVQAWNLPSGVYLYKEDSNFFVSFYLAQDENDDDEVIPTRYALHLMDGIIIANKGVESSSILVFRPDGIYGSFTVSSSGELWDSKFPPSNFQGADEERNGASGLVPAPSSNDYNKFLSGSGIWQAIGGFNILTEDDLNWEDPQTGDEYVALWLLPTGHYTTDENSPNVVISTDELNGDYIPGYAISVDMSPLIIINNNDPGSGNTDPDIMIINPDEITHYVIAGDTGLIDSVQGYNSPFTGTDGSTDGTDGLVPAPTSADVDKFLRSDGSWVDVGGVTALTSDDYNANSSNWSDTNPSNFNCVALWKMPRGMYYKADSSVNVYISTTRFLSNTSTAIIGAPSGNGTPIITLSEGNSTNNGWKIADAFIVGSLGAELATWGLYQPKDNLTSASANEAPLSAKQGKALKDLIDALDARVSALEGN